MKIRGLNEILTLLLVNCTHRNIVVKKRSSTNATGRSMIRNIRYKRWITRELDKNVKNLNGIISWNVLNGYDFYRLVVSSGKQNTVRMT